MTDQEFEEDFQRGIKVVEKIQSLLPEIAPLRVVAGDVVSVSMSLDQAEFLERFLAKTVEPIRRLAKEGGVAGIVPAK